MGRLKLILGGAVVLVVAVVVAGVAILNSMDFNQYKGEISKQTKAATGRDLVISGDLSLELSLSPRVSVNGVSLTNAPWGSRPEMVKLKSFAAEMKLIPLLFGDIHIVELILIEPDILLETDKNGKGNWVFGNETKDEAKKEETEKDSGGSLPAVNAIRIEKARFTYKDGVKSEETTIVIDTMQANADDMDDPLNLLFKGAFNDHIIELTGQLGSPEALMNGDALDINLSLKAADAVLSVIGKIDDPMAGKGLNLALTAKSENIAKLAEIGGVKVGKVGPFNMSATVSDGDKSYKLGGLKIKVGASDLSGDITVNLAGKVPAINVALSSELLNTKDVTPVSDTAAPVVKAKKETKKTDKVVKLFPTDALPIDALKSVNAEVSFKAKKLIVSDFTLHNFSKDVSLKGGKLNVKPSFTMGGGNFGGLIALDGRKLPARLKIDLTGKDLGLGASLKETGITDMIEDGKTQIRINLAGSGKSVAALMASLNGQSLINVGKGKINSKFVNLAGGDLVTQLTGALNPMAKKQDFTPLACVVVNLNFKKGLADYDKKIAIQTDAMNITSSGEINLAKETLDIGIKPEPRGDSVDLGINAGGLASMVRLTGPLSAPGVGIDALQTAKAAMGVGAAIATGGLSLLVSGLTDKAMADGDPCATALGKKSTQKKAAPASSGTTKKKEESPNPVGSLLNLFGGDN